jgi:hypothetical protein
LVPFERLLCSRRAESLSRARLQLHSDTERLEPAFKVGEVLLGQNSVGAMSATL